MKQVFCVTKIIFLLETTTSIWGERVALVKDSTCCEGTYSLCWRRAMISLQNPATIMVRAIHSSQWYNPWKKYSILHTGILYFYFFSQGILTGTRKDIFTSSQCLSVFPLLSLDSHQIERSWKKSVFARAAKKPFCIHKQQLLQKVFDQAQRGVLS